MKRTATALLRSWYCRPTTLASAGCPSSSASIRTRSWNSRGNVEMNIACSGLPYSTITFSRSSAFPPRGAVTFAAIRTGRACGKNLANCSTQSCSFAVSARSPDFPTFSPTPPATIQERSRIETHHSLCEAQTSEEWRCTPYAKKLQT